MPPEAEIERLLGDFRAYDRTVDIVSAWEFLFTGTNLADDVEHFERFPAIPLDGSNVTPDFTVLFRDGGGLAGEAATFPLNEEGVDDLCEQLTPYDRLRELPSGGGGCRPVAHTEVMLIVPVELGTAAVRRIIRERLEERTHPYKPGSSPIIVQVAFDQDKYVFQRIADAVNGTFRDDGRSERLSAWFENNTVPVAPGRFSEIKAARAFINDPIPELYLATFLWSKTFPVMAAGQAPALLQTTAAELAESLRNTHGKVRSNDVERALQLLRRADLARELPKSWEIEWRELRPRGRESELADALARRAVAPPPRRPVKEVAPDERREYQQEQLF